MTSPALRTPALPRRVVIATAGHVDHGKTSLIRRLTGVDTDRLPDEKRRGISIELGFAELAGAGISFIDVPGHHKLVHAMIAGVGGVDAVLLVVAADDAVMPQTREHLSVCALLGVERILVALTKVDLVDEETVELAEADIAAALESMDLRTHAVVRTSAQTGEGIEELERQLRALCNEIPERAASARVWLPIDRVFSIKGAGTVVTGTLTRGELRIGQTLYVVGESGIRETSCRSLEIHGASVERARAPTRLALNLARLELDEVERGQVVSADPELARTQRLDVRLRTLPGSDKALKPRSPAVVHLGTTRVAARVVRYGAHFARLSLEHPVPAEGGVGVILRGFSASRQYGRVLGGGKILDANPLKMPRRKDAAALERRSEALSALEQNDLPRALGAYLDLSAPRAVDATELERRFGTEPGAVSSVLRKLDDAVGLPDGRRWTSRRVLGELGRELCAALGRYHTERPHELGQSVETARAELAERVGRELAALVIERAAKEGSVLLDQDLLALPEFAKSAGAAAQKSDGRLLGELDKALLQGVTENELATRLGDKPQNVRAGLGRLQGAGRARRLGGMWFAEGQIDTLRERVRHYLQETQKMNVSDFKTLAGVSRKQAIPLLEQFDREGTTRRQGDERVLGAGKGGPK